MVSILGRGNCGLKHVLGQLPVSMCGAEALGFLFLSRTVATEGVSDEQSGKRDLLS